VWGLSHALKPFKMPATDRGLFAELQVIVLADVAKGKRIVVPRPRSLSMSMCPPDCFTKPYTMLRPRPVP
jgi:hypothetical protein